MIINNKDLQVYINDKDIIYYSLGKGSDFSFIYIYLKNVVSPQYIAFKENDKSKELINKLEQIIDNKERQEIFKLEKPY